jgi:hypothetical protein
MQFGGMAMQIGDEVTWANDFRGRTITTDGVIIGVIPPECRPSEEEFPEFWVEVGPGPDREEESYVVQVEAHDTKAGRRLFWPKANLLKKKK